jgi:hypothetical protein
MYINIVIIIIVGILRTMVRIIILLLFIVS